MRTRYNDNNFLKKLMGLTFIALIFTTIPSYAQEYAREDEDTFEQWDTNDDDMIDESEYEAGWSEYDAFNEWDLDGDNLLSEREYSEGLFGEWDLDDDGLLDEDEYDEGVDYWSDEFDDSFAEWDANDDNFLDNDEFYGGMNEGGLFANIDEDGDGLFDEKEFQEGFFGLFDKDDDSDMDDMNKNQKDNKNDMNKDQTDNMNDGSGNNQ